MKAVVLRETGTADQLELSEVERPRLVPGHALVKVFAAGVCYRDVIDRRGGFPFMKLPVIPGHELAGEVVEVADDVSGVAPGDRVVNLHRPPCGECEACRAGHEPRCTRGIYAFGLTADGAYAEYVLAPARCLVPMPHRLSYADACFLACTAGVALRALRTHGRLQPGQTALITGATGGVGLHGLQVARLLGARAIAVTSSPAKADVLRQLGAHDVVVSEDLHFHRQVQTLTGGVHVALDCVGAPTLNASVRSLRPIGRAIVVGNITTERAQLNPGLIILNEVAVEGSAGCNRSDLEQVLGWAADGHLRPVVAETMPLARARDAHRRLEQRGVIGRLVLTPQSN